MASRTATQLVTWPLVGALLVVAVRQRWPARRWLPLAAIALLLAATGLLALGQRDVVASVWFFAWPLLVVCFPDGRFPARWLTVPVAGSLVLAVSHGLSRGEVSKEGWWPAAILAAVALTAVPIYRYRTTTDSSERKSLRWGLLGLIISFESFAILGLVSGTIGGPGAVSEALANIAALPLPAGFAVGLLAGSKWNVDAGLHAVVLATILGIPLAAAYAGVSGLALHSGAQPAVAGWLGAGTVAVLAVPSFHFGRQVAGRLLYRGRPDASTVMARLDNALAAQNEVKDIPLAALRSIVADVGLSGAALRGGGMLQARTGLLGSVNEVFPVLYQNEQLATLLVPPRRGEDELSHRDREILALLASHLGPALHGARSMAALTDAHSLLLNAREEERRRLRRDLHDDLSPTLAGLTLSAAAFARRARDIDQALADSALELQQDIQSAVRQSREIAYDLRPPILDTQGLVSAIAGRINAQDTEPLELRIEAPERIPELPAAVDVAALRIVQEAVANVRRHAQARTCVVRLSITGGRLEVSVTDDGIGLPELLTPGLGIASIKERARELGGSAHFAAAEGGGSRVSVTLPVQESGAA